MNEPISFGSKVFIRNAGKDEYWLQDLIYKNPAHLGLGDLVPVNKEKKQVSGGRLDILLRDPADNNAMYEVEVMLGETDPSHIIRAIEYWDNEKRKYPQRQHYCVLVAESFDRRYFNVIQILSLNVPMIAIQTDLLKVKDDLVLNFSKVLDIYVEPEDEEESAPVDEKSWNTKSSWSLKTAQKLFSILKADDPQTSINFTQSYISIVVENRNSYMFDKRTKPNSMFWFNVKDEEKQEAIKKILDEKDVSYSFNKYKDFSLTIDTDFMDTYKDMMVEIHAARYKELSCEDE
ncbi:MAG: hypothetical protein HN742_35200 [Lentisphaerae bacterium]|jgi:hypothetical protein|nr:hypothetical protein [Lentisphaerota bacterium]MBT7055205.1 hypothetical protein [Lentisphaerota bacterium]MBT7847170.1 hypothetical protein [Lentisphaerota bacterium]MBT7912928.1 hypothetical protein [Candidatus Bathyarchaeota archaeon]